MLCEVIGEEFVVRFEKNKDLYIKITAKDYGKTFPEIIWILYKLCNDPLFNALWMRKYLNQTWMIFDALTKALRLLNEKVDLDLTEWLDYKGGAKTDKIYWKDYNGIHNENRMIFLGSFDQYNKIAGRGPAFGYWGRITIEEPVLLDDDPSKAKAIDNAFMGNLWAMYDTFGRFAKEEKATMSVCCLMNNWDENHPLITYADEKAPYDKQVIRSEHRQLNTFTDGPLDIEIERGCKLFNPVIKGDPERMKKEIMMLPAESIEMYNARVWGEGFRPTGRRRFIYDTAFKHEHKPVDGTIYKTCSGIDWGSGDKTALAFGMVVKPDNEDAFILVQSIKEWDNNKRKQAGLHPMTSSALITEIVDTIAPLEDTHNASQRGVVRIQVDGAASQTNTDFKDYLRRTGKNNWISNKAPKLPSQKWGILDRQVWFTNAISDGRLRFADNLDGLKKKFKRLYYISGENENKRIEKNIDLDAVNAVEYMVSGLKNALKIANRRNR